MITLNNIKTNKKWIKVLSLSAIAAIVSACTQANAAKVQDLSDSPSASATTTKLVYDTSTTSTYSRPPANISRSNSTDNYSTTTTQSNGNVVTTTQERIVYNRNYDDIPKGGYNGNTYTVRHGDTLFYIAWITGNDFRSLAAKNGVQEPYDLTVGQVLDVSGGTTVVVTEQTVTTSNSNKPAVTTTKTTSTTTAPNKTQPVTSTTTTTTTTDTNANSKPIASANVADIIWQWPAKGKIIETFSNATKGIDIAGSVGDKVVAAADGRVVYVGNALPGYGNLIIVKHNDDYLTAYAHNQGFLVKEQQDVKAGQQIATMGNTGTTSVRLHFEVRYKAKSVNPLTYLPKNDTL